MTGPDLVFINDAPKNVDTTKHYADFKLIQCPLIFLYLNLNFLF